MLPSLRRYGAGARWYDVLSLERPVYRGGRVAAMARFGLRPGDRVLDVGCGTGLNFPFLLDAVGARGEVVGIDASPQMLQRAQTRITQAGWANVSLVQGDAATSASLLAGREPFDAVVFTYSLGVIGDWQAAWNQALGLLRPGGRVAVVDLALPAGRWLFLWPWARLACLTGGVDPHRHPWRLLAATASDVAQLSLTGGHVHVAVGTFGVSARPGPRR